MPPPQPVRLARLAAKYGSEITLVDLLAMLAGSRPKWDANRPGIERCGAFFLNLIDKPPPDSPKPRPPCRRGFGS